MEKIDTKDDTTQMTSSSVEWLAVLAVIGIILLAVLGAKRQKTSNPTKKRKSI